MPREERIAAICDSTTQSGTFDPIMASGLRKAKPSGYPAGQELTETRTQGCTSSLGRCWSHQADVSRSISVIADRLDEIEVPADIGHQLFMADLEDGNLFTDSPPTLESWKFGKQDPLPFLIRGGHQAHEWRKRFCPFDITAPIRLPGLITDAYKRFIGHRVCDTVAMNCIPEALFQHWYHIPESFLTPVMQARLGYVDMPGVTADLRDKCTRPLTVPSLAQALGIFVTGQWAANHPNPYQGLDWILRAKVSDLTPAFAPYVDRRVLFAVKHAWHLGWSRNDLAVAIRRMWKDPSGWERDRMLTLMEANPRRGSKDGETNYIVYVPVLGYYLLPYFPQIANAFVTTVTTLHNIGMCPTQPPPTVTPRPISNVSGTALCVNGEEVALSKMVMDMARLCCGLGISYQDSVRALEMKLRNLRTAQLPVDKDWPNWNLSLVCRVAVAAVWTWDKVDVRYAWKTWVSQFPAADGWYAIPQPSIDGPEVDRDLLMSVDVSLQETVTSQYHVRCLLPDIPQYAGMKIMPLYDVEWSDYSISCAIAKRIIRKRQRTRPPTEEEIEEFISWVLPHMQASDDAVDPRKQCEITAAIKFGVGSDEYNKYMVGVDRALSGDAPDPQWGKSYELNIKREVYSKAATLRFVVSPPIEMRGYSKACLVRAEHIWAHLNPHTIKGKTPDEVLHMLDFSHPVCQQDASGFEVLVDSLDLDIQRRLFRRICPTDADNIDRYYSVINQTHQVRNKFFTVTGVPPMTISGSESTSIGNAFTNLCMFYTTLRRMGLSPNWEDWFIVEGDDLEFDLAMLGGKSIDEYQQVGSELGMVLTLDIHASPYESNFLGYHIQQFDGHLINEPMDPYDRLSRIFWDASPDLCTNKHDTAKLKARIMSALYWFKGSSITPLLCNVLEHLPAVDSKHSKQAMRSFNMYELENLPFAAPDICSPAAYLDRIGLTDWRSQKFPELHMEEPSYISDVQYVGPFYNRNKYSRRVLQWLSAQSQHTLADLASYASSLVNPQTDVTHSPEKTFAEIVTDNPAFSPAARDILLKYYPPEVANKIITSSQDITAQADHVVDKVVIPRDDAPAEVLDSAQAIDPVATGEADAHSGEEQSPMTVEDTVDPPDNPNLEPLTNDDGTLFHHRPSNTLAALWMDLDATKGNCQDWAEMFHPPDWAKVNFFSGNNHESKFMGCTNRNLDPTSLAHKKPSQMKLPNGTKCTPKLDFSPVYALDWQYMEKHNPALQLERSEELSRARVGVTQAADSTDFAKYTIVDAGGNGACLVWSFVYALKDSLNHINRSYIDIVHALTTYMWQEHRMPTTICDLPPIVQHVVCHEVDGHRTDAYYPGAPLPITIHLFGGVTHFYAMLPVREVPAQKMLKIERATKTAKREEQRKNEIKRERVQDRLAETKKKCQKAAAVVKKVQKQKGRTPIPPQKPKGALSLPNTVDWSRWLLSFLVLTPFLAVVYASYASMAMQTRLVNAVATRIGYSAIAWLPKCCLWLSTGISVGLGLTAYVSSRAGWLPSALLALAVMAVSSVIVSLNYLYLVIYPVLHVVMRIYRFMRREVRRN